MSKKEKRKRLIDIYELILYGDKERMGLFDKYDPYYTGCWDDLLAEAKTIKDKLNQNKDEG